MKIVSLAQAQGTREYQEDRFGVSHFYGGTLAWVADGHGGEEASEEIAKRIHEKWILYDNANVETQIRDLYRGLDLQTCEMESGAVLSLVYMPRRAPLIYVAVLGDSPVIVKSGSNIFIGPDHNARSNQVERDAAVARGAIYMNGYVCEPHFDGHGLQMTRALGDHGLGWFLNREPEIRSLGFGEYGDWVLVASDGVLDPSHHNTNEGDVIAGLINSGAEAPELVTRATKVPTHDNATAILVRVS